MDMALLILSVTVVTSRVALPTERVQHITYWQGVLGGSAVVAWPKAKERGPDPNVEDVISQVDGEDWTFVPVSVHVI